MKDRYVNTCRSRLSESDRSESKSIQNYAPVINVNDSENDESDIYHIPSPNAEVKNKIKTTVGSLHIEALIDTGAVISCMSKQNFEKSNVKCSIEPSKIKYIKGVSGAAIGVIGQAFMPICIGGLELYHHIHILDKLSQPLILGYDFLKEQHAELSFKSSPPIISIQYGMIEVPLCTQGNGKSFAVYTMNTMIIPPRTEMAIPVKVNNKFVEIGTIEPVPSLATKYHIMGARCVVDPKGGKTGYRIMNTTMEPLTLPGRTMIGLYNKLPNDAIQFYLNPDASQSMPTVMSMDTTKNDTNQKYIQIAEELGFDLNNSDLTDEQKQTLLVVLGQNRDVFAKDISELGCTNLHHHVIDTGNAPPVSQRFYRTTPEKKEEIEKQVQQMLQDGIIEPSTTPWVSPVVLVKKKSGEYRFAVDYRRLNQLTKPIQFPLPRLEDVFDTIGEKGAQIFTSLDLASGYWQVPMDQNSKEKTGFITQSGVYQFKKMPFGLTNAPMSFQKTMTEVLRGINWQFSLVYIDDILIFSQDFDSHLDHLHQIFDRLRNANLRLKPGKCNFAVTSVPYLGHVLSKEGISVDPNKTHAVSTYPTPKSVKDIRAFIGLCNYYRRFVKGFAKIAKPMNQLLEKDVKFKWSPECELSFQQLKEALTSTPIIAFPDFNKEFILYTDASDFALGYVLGQLDEDGRERVIAYGGKSLNKEEQKWHSNTKECYALFKAVQAYHVYLASRKFKIYTDNTTVKSFMKQVHTDKKLVRWVTYLQQYAFDTIYKPGKQNTNADGVSRRQYDSADIHTIHVDNQSNNSDFGDTSNETPTECTNIQYNLEYTPHKPTFTLATQYINKATPEKQQSTVLGEIEQAQNNYNLLCPIEILQQHLPLSREGLIQAQQEDSDLNPIIQYIRDKILPDDISKAHFLKRESFDYFLEQGVLHKLEYPRGKGHLVDRQIKVLVIPAILRNDILRAYHDSLTAGHNGFERTLAAIRLKYYWHAMRKDIEYYVKSCVVCQQTKRTANHNQKAPLQPMPVEDVFSRLHLDFLGPITETENGEKHILLIVDSFTSWCEAFPLKSQKATEVARILYNEIICRYGAPDSILTDRGQCFMSQLLKELCSLLNIKKISTSSYHPQTNATCERMNSVINTTLRAYCDNKQKNWANLLQSVMMAYRVTPNTSSGFSPYFLLFGRECRTPIDTALNPVVERKTHQQHLDQVMEGLIPSREIAKENRIKAQQIYKAQYDKKAKQPDFRVGKLVWLYCQKTPQGLSPKLHQKWTGPYYISIAHPNFTYKLHRCDNNRPVKSLVNAARIKHYIDPENRPTNPPNDIQGDLALNPEELPEEEQTQDDIIIDQQTALSNEPVNNTPVANTKVETQVKSGKIQSKPPNDGKFYTIDKLLQSKYFGNVKHFRVKWDGFKYTTWEPVNNLPTALVREFVINRHNKRKNRGSKRTKTPFRDMETNRKAQCSQST